MSDGVVVYGAGGHGKVVADAVLRCGRQLEGFIDDDPSRTGASVLGVPVLGIGRNDLRARIATACQELGATLVTIVHPTATIASSATIAEGVVVFAHAVINADAVVGRAAIINTGAIVEHDCIVGELAHLSPRAVLGGGCRIGVGAQLGIGAVMLPGRSIGDYALVGGGAVVVRDIAAGVTAVGIPARPLGR